VSVVADVAIRCVVAGRVQGVFYRASAAEQARRLGLSGWVRNCSDGTVEVVAVGRREALGEFTGWLWRGPRLARVTGVTVEDYDGEEVARGRGTDEFRVLK
jgi:acylphosphatase